MPLDRRKDSVRWSDGDLYQLSTSIAAFKLKEVEVFQKFQPYKIVTIQWHMLDHLPAGLQRFGVYIFWMWHFITFLILFLKTTFELYPVYIALQWTKLFRLDVVQGISRSTTSEKVTRIRGWRRSALLNDTARLVRGVHAILFIS